MQKRNVLIDVFGWVFLLPCTYRTLFIGQYLRSPYLEPINYAKYDTLAKQLSITMQIWVRPAVSAIVSPLFILIGMGIIFRQKWARILLITVCALELIFVSSWMLVATILNPVWIAKNLLAEIYFDDILWFAAIPLLCLIIFTRPEIKRFFT
ncbi:MAG: hypothetical protein NG740_01260 [Omnitrophica bacterium]|nr:hypothetical protein [Candidatus Omnitrophota bacterium]